MNPLTKAQIESPPDLAKEPSACCEQCDYYARAHDLVNCPCHSHNPICNLDKKCCRVYKEEKEGLQKPPLEKPDMVKWVKRYQELSGDISANADASIRMLVDEIKAKSFQEGVEEGESTKNGMKRYLMGYKEGVAETKREIGEIATMNKDWKLQPPLLPYLREDFYAGYNKAFSDLKDFLTREEDNKI